MGLPALPMLGLSLALGAVQTFVSIGQSRSAAKAQAKAAARQSAAVDAEMSRRQREALDVEADQRSEVVRRADRELGAIRAAGAELGATSTAISRMVVELGAAEGLDLSRIRRNTKSAVESLQASKTGAHLEATSQVEAAQRAHKANVTSSVFGFVGHGLSLVGSYNRYQTTLDTIRRRADIDVSTANRTIR